MQVRKAERGVVNMMRWGGTNCLRGENTAGSMVDSVIIMKGAFCRFPFRFEVGLRKKYEAEAQVRFECC